MSVPETVVELQQTRRNMHPAEPSMPTAAAHARPSHATIAGSTCGVYQPVEIDYADSHGCAALPVRPCSVCHLDLGCFGAQFQCECGKIVCPDCTATVPDPPPSILLRGKSQRLAPNAYDTLHHWRA
jgi:hypothetical protein